MSSDSSILGLFAVHRSELVRYASRILGDSAQAEDVVQEAWLRFDSAVRAQSFDEPLPYLYRIVRNLALDFGRRVSRERQHSYAQGSGDRDDAASRPSPEAEAAGRQELRILSDAVAELPERVQVALEMHRIHGCTLKEIAARLGISIGLAHGLVAQGLEHCRARLYGDGQVDDS